ncbi:FtsQ-type POTRA domain-containing protein [Rugosimonospora acidiphila]|uniref:Cell division protein FtsQ n=1 Tax=Rugosimonospora acidiphila TaxID=556531 RepID=A0ABP9SI86_9ACTN
MSGRSGRGDERGARRWTLVRAPAQAVPASVRRFNQRARDRRLQAAAPWLAGLAAIVLLALVALVVYQTSLLGVRDVAVRGNAIVGVDQVRAAAAVPHGAPLASLDLRAVQRRVQALPAVARARVTRHWPSTVVVTVTERSAVAVVAAPDKRYQELDASGVVFRTVPSRPDRLPLVALSAPGPSDPSTRAALRVLASLTGDLRSLLGTLEAPSPDAIRLRLTDGRQVVWGDANSDEVKAAVATVLLRQHNGDVIDVSAPNTATVN